MNIVPILSRNMRDSYSTGSIVKFWITTPSYNMAEWLPIAIESVLNQVGDGVEVHHHVQDGGSSDGTVDFLKAHAQRVEESQINGYTFSYDSSPDDGMYDAINRGWEKISGKVDVVAYLNCDEQYLTGVFNDVAVELKRKPNAEVIMSDFIILSQSMDYICHKRSVLPVRWMARFCSIGSPCATFIRSDAFQSKKLTFDTRWRIVGDVVWFKKMVDARTRFHVMHKIVTAFVDVEGNLSESAQALEERQEFRDAFQGKWSCLAPKIYALHALRRWLTNSFLSPPGKVCILNEQLSKHELLITHPTCRWKRKQSTC